MGDDFVTVLEAAGACQRNPETVRRWIWEGKLPAQKVGRQLFVLKADLLALQAKLEQPRQDALQAWLGRLEAFHGSLRAQVMPSSSLSDLHELREERLDNLARLA